MKNDATIVREWFIERSNREKISKAIEQEVEESILSTLLSTIGFCCERFSESTLLSWTLPIDYLKHGQELLVKHLTHKSSLVRYTAALALTQFRITEAWDILYEFIEKANSKMYVEIAIRLFYFGNNRLKIFDQRDNGEYLRTLDLLNITYHKEGLTQQQIKRFQIALESVYRKKITDEAKDAIIKALQSIGNNDTITFFNQVENEESDKYRKENIVKAIEVLQQRLT